MKSINLFKYFLLFISVEILDIITTYIFIQLGGVEGNTLMGELMYSNFPMVVLIYKIPIILGAFFFYLFISRISEEEWAKKTNLIAKPIIIYIFWVSFLIFSWINLLNIYYIFWLL